MPIFKKKTDKKKPLPTKVAEPVQVEHTHVKYDKFETIDGVYKTTIPDRIKNKPKWERPDPRRIMSYIPGTITSIDVKVGDVVNEGDKILMFKAMKMSNTYLSPFAGTVKKIHVAIDEIVPKGRILIEFE